MVCICFSMIGIPLFLLSVSKLSDDLGNLFRMVYSSLIRFLFGNCSNTNSARKSEINMNGDEGFFESAFIKNEDLNTTKESNEDDEDDYVNISQRFNIEDFHLSNKLINSRVSVPLTIAILIFCCYIALGTFIFKYLEGWSHIESSYFSFITMATIGNVFIFSLILSIFYLTLCV